MRYEALKLERLHHGALLADLLKASFKAFIKSDFLSLIYTLSQTDSSFISAIVLCNIALETCYLWGGWENSIWKNLMVLPCFPFLFFTFQSWCTFYLISLVCWIVRSTSPYWAVDKNNEVRMQIVDWPQAQVSDMHVSHCQGKAKFSDQFICTSVGVFLQMNV